MAFPFYWIGAFLAGAVLGAALTLFVLAMRAVDRAATEVSGSILPGLVEGIRDWADDRRRAPRRPVSPGGPEAGDEIEEAPSSTAPAVERLRPHLR